MVSILMNIHSNIVVVPGIFHVVVEIDNVKGTTDRKRITARIPTNVIGILLGDGNNL